MKKDLPRVVKVTILKNKKYIHTKGIFLHGKAIGV